MEIKSNPHLTAEQIVRHIQAGPVVFYVARSYRIINSIMALFILLAAVAFFWLAYEDTNHLAQWLVSWFFAVVCGGLGLMILLKNLKSRPSLTLSPNGITDHINLEGALVPWKEISDVRIHQVGRRASFKYQFKKPEFVWPLLPSWHQTLLKKFSLGAPAELGVPLLFLGGTDAREVVKAIEHFKK